MHDDRREVTHLSSPSDDTSRIPTQPSPTTQPSPAQPSPTQPSATDRASTRRRELRAAITNVALDLVLARGLDDVTVDEIARAANVSRRTFFNYFPTKAAACMPGTFPPDREAVHLFFSDRTIPTLTAVGRLLWRQVAMAHQESAEFDRFHDMWRREPALRPEVHAILTQTEAQVATLIARRDGLDRGSVESATVAAASIAILRVAVEQWRTDESPEQLEHRIRDAFEAVARSMELDSGSGNTE